MNFPFSITQTDNNLHILRDDLLPGGTKRRALTIMLEKESANRIAYAGTILGHGALALAHAAQDTGKTAEIFMSCANDKDPMLSALRKTTAILHIEKPLPVSTLYKFAQQNKTADSILLPPGFDIPEFGTALKESLSGFDAAPYSEIWTTCVSGTLTRALQSCFPNKVFKTVKIAKYDNGTGGADLFTAPEKYHQPAKNPPPYPACPYTDAKLWQFASKAAGSRVLLWNTAGNL